MQILPGLERFEGEADPSMQGRRRPIPTACPAIEVGPRWSHQTLAFEKAQWVLQFQLKITTALLELAGHHTMHQEAKRDAER